MSEIIVTVGDLIVRERNCPRTS